jgi:hypothetical protein
MQVPLPCYAVRQKDGVRALVGHYLVDFVYTSGANGIVYEDAKGYRTDLYRWKKKHVEAQEGIIIREV